MGNQYYLIVENPLEQNDEINFGFRVDNLFGNDWQFNYMQGFFERRLQARPVRRLRPRPDLRRGPPALPDQGGHRRQGGPVLHDRRLRSGAGDRPSAPLGPLHVQLRPAVHPLRRASPRSTSPTGSTSTTVRSTAGTAGSTSTTSGATSAASPGPRRTSKTSLAFTTVWGPNQFPSSAARQPADLSDRLRQRPVDRRPAQPRLRPQRPDPVHDRPDPQVDRQADPGHGDRPGLGASVPGAARQVNFGPVNGHPRTPAGTASATGSSTTSATS